MEEKQSFVFYRSFRDALAGVGDDERVRIYDAIIDYALDGKEPQGLDPVALVAFRLMRPRLDANERRRQNGAKGKECGRRGGNPAFKKGRPNPYYPKGRKAEEEICEQTCEGSEDNPKDIPEDKGKITPSGECEEFKDNPKDIPEDNPEGIPEDNPEDKGKTTPSDGREGSGKTSEGRKDNPYDISKISPSGGGEDNGETTAEDSWDISAEDKARVSETGSPEGGRYGREGGKNTGKGVELDIADSRCGGEDAEKNLAKGPKDPRISPKITPKITTGITPTYPADVDINIINENGNERDISLSDDRSANVNERETSSSGNRSANVNERETSFSGGADKAPAEAVFQSVPGAAVSESEAGEKKMKEFCERFKIVRDFSGPLLREVDWGKVAAEYEASEYLATMPRYKSLKWICYNHLTIEGGCYRPKKTEKRSDCVERQRPVEGNPFRDWLTGDGEKN